MGLDYVEETTKEVRESGPKRKPGPGSKWVMEDTEDAEKRCLSNGSYVDCCIPLR